MLIELAHVPTTATQTMEQKRKHRPTVHVSVGMWQIPTVKNVKMKYDLHNQLFPHSDLSGPRLRIQQSQTTKRFSRLSLAVSLWRIPKVQNEE